MLKRSAAFEKYSIAALFLSDPRPAPPPVSPTLPGGLFIFLYFPAVFSFFCIFRRLFIFLYFPASFHISVFSAVFSFVGQKQIGVDRPAAVPANTPFAFVFLNPGKVGAKTVPPDQNRAARRAVCIRKRTGVGIADIDVTQSRFFGKGGRIFEQTGRRRRCLGQMSRMISRQVDRCAVPQKPETIPARSGASRLAFRCKTGRRRLGMLLARI